jgi:RHS repeat-associated protein
VIQEFASILSRKNYLNLKKLDFSGVVLFANTFHKKTISDPSEVVINERFVYDNNFRLKQHYHKVNSNAEELLADYTYNELGQVTNKKVGNNLQSIDYTYNIRGAVTKVNDPANLGGKLFGYELKFASTANASVAPANYNGNITEMIWKNATDDVLKKYSYQYDAYNRLTAAIYQEPNSSLPQNGFYNETMSYDSNGNITNLKRNQKSYNNTVEEIDDLVYSYPNGNRLNSVVDLKNNYSGYPDISGNPMSYDWNGNMTSHVNKGILEIKYNDANLPSYIKFNNFVQRVGGDVYRNMTYSYRADGVKIKKTHHYFSGRSRADAFEITEYIDGFQYNNEQFGLTGESILKFFSTSEGYYDYVNNRYIYHYNDHLGNVRISFAREGNTAVIVQQNDYYAFGLKHGGPSVDLSGVNYKYQYNGKEMQDELGMYDYGARFYMPDLGRWGVVDPLAEISRRFSPYVYGNNNPVRFIDPDGRSAMDSFYDYHNFSNENRPMFSVDSQGNMHTNPIYKQNSYIDAGGSAGGGGGDPKPSIWQRIGNFFNSLFGFNKSKQAEVLPIAASNAGRWVVTSAELIPEGVEAALTWEEVMAAVGSLRVGVWALPLALNGDSGFAPNSKPLTIPTDVPITTTGEPDSGNLYLYRNMRSVNGLPMVGEGLDKLGLRDRDVNFLSNSTMITPLFSNGLSVTIGYGNIIPSDVPDTHKKQILFRIPASSLVSYGLIGMPVLNNSNPFYGQIRPATPMNVGTFRTLIQTTAPAWQPVK